MPITLNAARASAAPVKAFENFLTSRARPETGAGPVTLTDYLGRIRSYGARLHFARNESIFSQGDNAGQVYRIVSGMVRLCRYMPDGRRYIVAFLLPGELMGFAQTPSQPASAEAVNDVTLIAFPRTCFDRLARENTGARTQLLSHLSATLLTVQQHLFVLGCQKARERMASFLLRLADRLGLSQDDRLELAMSRQDIADHLGLTVETVSRAISALRAEGHILVLNAHQIVLRDRDALRTLAAEN